MRVRLFCFLVVLAAVTCRNVLASTDEFQDALAKAARTSTLTVPGAKPFHLKLSAADTRSNSSDSRRNSRCGGQHPINGAAN
jgi:hypothetical protein